MKFFIYKIQIPITNELYIGSTNNLYFRKKHHIDCSLYYFNPKYKIYDAIRKAGGWDKIEFSILEEVDIETKKEGKEKEQKYIGLLIPTLNIRLASTSHISDEDKRIAQNERVKKAYRNQTEEQKNKRKEYMKQYILNKKNIKDN